MFLRKERIKFEQEFKDMSIKHQKKTRENQKEIDNNLLKLDSLKKDFDSKWNSIRKIKQ